MPVTVVTGSEARPTNGARILWVGGATKPTNMLDGDLWFRSQGSGTTAPVFLTTSLNTITQSVAFSQALILNGTPPVTFAVTSGALPAGLSLNTTTGVISGTPTASGTYTFVVTATNAVGSMAQTYSGTVTSSAVAPTISVATLNSLTQGVAFNQTLSAAGTGPLTWSVTGGTLPAGLVLSASLGTITGSPTGSGAYSVTILVTNIVGTDSKVYAGTIASSGTAPTISTTTLTPLVVGTVFTQTLSRSGSTPITWGVTAGSIPAGLSINSSTGVIAGTPTTAAAYSFTVQATNAFGTATQVYTGTVSSGSVTTYSVFGGVAPNNPTSYSDGVSGAWNVHQFYSYLGDAALSAGSKIVGARLFIPTGSPHIGSSWKAGVILNPGAWYSDTNTFDSDAALNSGGTSKVGSALVAGWNDITFNTTYDPPAAVSGGGSWLIGVMIGTGTQYLFDTTLTGSAIKSSSGKNFYLAEIGSVPVARSWYQTHSSTAKWYGIDVIMTIP